MDSLSTSKNPASFDGQSARTFRAGSTAATSLVTLAGLISMVLQSYPMDLMLIALGMAVLPIATYHYGVRGSKASVQICGIVLVATLVPAWMVFLVRSDSAFRFVYVVIGSQISFLTSLTAGFLFRRKHQGA